MLLAGLARPLHSTRPLLALPARFMSGCCSAFKPKNIRFSTFPSRNNNILSRSLRQRIRLASTKSTSTSSVETPPVLTPPPVAGWLMFSSALVLAIVVVGGVTRLTESGLSITEWKPITGILPPLSDREWEEEFDKYKLTPEFKLLNSQMDVHQFKSIFYMEWGHRVLGRLIGLIFVGPLVYFVARKKVAKPIAWRLSGLAVLIGLQGIMGWYMVKSGLEDSIMTTPGAVPRVSHYRLASHLTLAFALYVGMFHMGFTALKEWKFANGQPWMGLKDLKVLQNPIVKSFTLQSRILFGLVFITALAGAFVAGLDAGLVYNEWPLMGGRWIPPTDEMMSPSYAKSEDQSDLWWRNMFENPTTVQFNHRMLATATYLMSAAMFAQAMRPAVRKVLPPLARVNVMAVFGMANIQVLLGITTLWYLVPVSLAAAHQAGSLALLTTVIQLLISLRSPSMAAKAWRKIRFGKSGR